MSKIDNPCAHFEFDLPSGTYRAPYLTVKLWDLSAYPGSTLEFGAVPIYGAMTAVLRPGVLEVLIRQARGIRRGLPSVIPHLRIAAPRNFGRDTFITWYDTAIEEKWLLSGCAIPELSQETIDAIEREVMEARRL